MVDFEVPWDENVRSSQREWIKLSSERAMHMGHGILIATNINHLPGCEIYFISPCFFFFRRELFDLTVSLILFCCELNFILPRVYFISPFKFILFCREFILCRKIIIFCREFILFRREFTFCREFIIFWREFIFLLNPHRIDF